MPAIFGTPRGDVSVADAAQPASVSPWRTFNVATRAGVSVSHSEAMGISAFWACVMLIAKTAGSMPCDTLDDRRDVREVVVKLDPTDELRRAPELWPLPSTYVSPWRAEDGSWWYRYTVPTTGAVIDIPGSQVIHAAGPSIGDGTIGASPVETLRERLGVSIAASRYQARFFQNDGRPRGILSIEESLDAENATMIREQWHATYGGVENSHNIAVLDHGAKFQPVSISPEDAEFMDQMRFGATEIARIFGVPPGMIGAEGASLTYTNAQQNDQHFLKFTLRPYLREAEAALNRDSELFGVRSPWRPEFNVEDILRPDVVELHRMLREDVGAGLITRNEARSLLGRGPVAGGDDVSMLDPGNGVGGIGGTQDE